MTALPTLPWVLDLLAEMERASRRYGPFASSHEGYGVLAEEVAEFFEAMRANDPAAMQREALQVAAVAMRLHNSLFEGATLARSRK